MNEITSAYSSPLDKREVEHVPQRSKKMAIRDEIKQFCQTTTIKGLPRMIRAEGRYLRAMWAICVMFGSAVALYQIIYILTQFFLFETSTSIEELEKEETIFPDVTICKTNPPPILSGSAGGRLTLQKHIDTIENYMKESTNEEKDILEELLGLDGYFQTITDDNMAEFSGEHFIIECVYRFKNGDDIDCSHLNYSLSRFLTPSYPSCVSFRPDAFSKRKGIDVLSAIFYLDDFGPFYVPNFGSDTTFPQTKGIEIFIHPPNTFPKLRTGIVGSPGWETAIKIIDTRRQRVKKPYSTCRGGNYNDLDAAEDFAYTEDMCRHNCTQLRSLKTCHCLDPRFPTLPRQRFQNDFCGALYGKHTNVSYSREEIISKMDCLYNGTTTISDTCDEDCVENCLSLTFEYHSMGGMWPHESRQLAFYDKYINGKGYPKDFAVYDRIKKQMETNALAAYAALQEESLIRRNFLKIKVYFDGRNVLQYKDTPIHTPSSVSGSLGGILNLWIGISFVTAIELAELIYKLFLTLFVKKDREQNPARVT